MLILLMKSLQKNELTSEARASYHTLSQLTKYKFLRNIIFRLMIDTVANSWEEGDKRERCFEYYILQII